MAETGPDEHVVALLTDRLIAESDDPVFREAPIGEELDALLAALNENRERAAKQALLAPGAGRA